MRIASLVLAAVLAAALPIGASAQSARSSTEGSPGAGARTDAKETTVQGPQAPMGGRAFGEHVSGMAPEHPIDHGRMFGECVSEMAITGSCPHHDEM